MLWKGLFFLTLSCVTTVGGFTFTQTGNKFTVKLKDILLLSHSPTSPCLYVGQVSIIFNEHLGNFHLKDSVNERVGLTDFAWTAANTTLKMSYAGYWVNLVLVEDSDTAFTIDVVGHSSNVNHFWLRLVSSPNEKVYGGGEQFSYFNLKGQTFPIWTREQGVGRNLSTLTTFYSNVRDGGGGDYYTTYFSQPTFISSLRYYFHYTGSNYASLDFSNPSYHEISIHNLPMKPIKIATDASFKQLVSGLISMLGKVPELPDWIYDGAVIGVQGGTEKMMDYINMAEAHGMKITGAWIQDWSGTIDTSFGQRVFWNWEWNPDRYPGLNETIRTLKSRGIRIFVYVNSILNVNGSIYKNANKDYFIKNKKGEVLEQNFGEFYCATVDLTFPDAFEWFKKEVLIKNIINFGFGGWMADFGEYTPTDAVMHAGNAEVLHNEWPALWARMNREALQETGTEGDIVFFMRAGFTGSGNYSVMMWAGDQNVDFSYADGLASTIPAALSMGLTSHGLTHFDIGGYTTAAQFGLVRTEERLLRGAEHAVFGPMFRTHEGNQPKANVQFYSNEWITVKFARLVSMFTLLKNYSKSVVKVTSQTGLPAQRPLFLNYENDPGSYDVKYQYMYGDDLLVAPVFLSGQTEWDVYLPKDPTSSWIFLWTGEEMQGPKTVRVKAPVGQPPVFYRKMSSYADVFRIIGNMSVIVTPATTTAVPLTKVTHLSCSAGLLSSSVVLGLLSLLFSLRALCV